MQLHINWNPSPYLFQLGNFELRYYSLLFMVAFLAAALTLRFFLKKENKTTNKLDVLMTYIIVGTLVGARLGHVIFYDWAYFKDHIFEIFLPFRFSPKFEFTGFAGLASHGALVGIFIAVVLFVRKHKDFSLVWLLDRGSLAAVIGGAFVRMGNFMNSEIVGKVVDCNFPFAVKFVKNTDDLSFREVSSKTGISDYYQGVKALLSDAKFSDVLSTIPCRHPAQLYESACYILIFIILMVIYLKTDKKKVPFFLFGMFLILTWSARFLVEFVKESQGGFESVLGVFSTGQWLSIPLILFGFFLVLKKPVPQPHKRK